MVAPVERVSCFVDGFNMYHAILELGQPHLKWLDLWALMRLYAGQPYQEVTAVYYFSAFATWLPDPYRRHRAYVRALQAVGVRPIMGAFKEKRRLCKLCKGVAWSHEEKQTDVNARCTC